MNGQLLLFNLVLLALVSLPLTAARSSQDCTVQMKKAGFGGDRFPAVVAHGVHSLTVEDLRLFKPDVDATNRVPGVNQDMTVEEPLLPSAPFAEVIPGGTFKTYGMQLLDRVLSNMDRLNYDSGLDTLERVFHAFHMAEFWNMALIQYQKLVHDNASKAVCPCMLDIDANGVTEALRNVSKNQRSETGVRITRDLYCYGLYSCGRYIMSDTKFDFNRDGVPIKQTELAPLPKLTSSANWAQWKKFYTTMYMYPEDDRMLAYFLYCALN